MRSLEQNKIYKEEKKILAKQLQLEKKIKKAQVNSKLKKDLQFEKKSLYSKQVLGKTRRQRLKLGQKLTKKMENERFKWAVGELDKQFSIFIRNRDANKNCVTFGVKGCHNKIHHNCHFIGRAYYSHRRDENNCHGGCRYCNTYAQEEHKIQYTMFMIKLFGEEFVNNMLAERNKKKPNIDWMEKKIQYYKKLNNTI